MIGMNLKPDLGRPAGFFAKTALSAILIHLTAAPAGATVLPPAYGVGTSASIGIPSGQVINETCVGNGGTFNPCVDLNSPAISGDGTSASALLEGNYEFPTSDPNVFLIEHERVAASGDLATGELHLDFSGLYQHRATVRYEDILYFDPASFTGDSATLTFKVTLDGTFQDANILYLFGVGGIDDGLFVQSSYTGQGMGQVQDIASPSMWQILSQTGDWNILGPNVFEGRVTVTAANPFLVIQNGLFGFGLSADFAHTAHLDMILPDGLKYTSASGVFMSQAVTGDGVPEPTTWEMLLLGFMGIGMTMRRRRVPMLNEVI